MNVIIALATFLAVGSFVAPPHYDLPRECAPDFVLDSVSGHFVSNPPADACRNLVIAKETDLLTPKHELGRIRAELSVRVDAHAEEAASRAEEHLVSRGRPHAFLAYAGIG